MGNRQRTAQQHVDDALVFLRFARKALAAAREAEDANAHHHRVVGSMLPVVDKLVRVARGLAGERPSGAGGAARRRAARRQGGRQAPAGGTS